MGVGGYEAMNVQRKENGRCLTFVLIIDYTHS